MQFNRTLVLVAVAIVVASSFGMAAVAANGSPFQNGPVNGNTVPGLSYMAVCSEESLAESDVSIVVTATKDGGSEATAVQVTGEKVDSVVVKFATTQLTFFGASPIDAGSSVLGGSETDEPNGAPCPEGQSGFKYEFSGTSLGPAEAVN
jgi:hypothetical protein